MGIDNTQDDLDSLQKLYDKESAELRSALLKGASWNDLKEKRVLVTNLFIAIHKKKYPHGGHQTPADTSLRRDK